MKKLIFIAVVFISAIFNCNAQPNGGFENWSRKINVFPNSVKDYITINAHIEEADNMQVIDIEGKLAGVYKIQSYNANINTVGFAEVIYLYEIRDKNNQTFTRGNLVQQNNMKVYNL